MKLKYIIVGLTAVVLTAACDDKLDVFTYDGPATPPAAIDMSTVKSEALPGQIHLSWEAPEGDFAYLQIRYYDPRIKEDVYKIASKGTTEMLIDETRARYGAYAFSFRTFNSSHEGGEVQTVEAVSGAAPATVTVGTKTKINITADQLSGNASDPQEGVLKYLVDGDAGTMYHTNWHETIPYPQYIQVDLKEPHENFCVYFQNRNDSWTTSGRPGVVELQVSNDGKDFETVATLSGLPSAASSEYTSTYVAPGKTFTYFRFNVLASSGNTAYFNLAELALYDVELSIYDPEADEEE